jgi:hypothetical protein
MAIEDYINFGQLGAMPDPLDEESDFTAMTRVMSPRRGRESSRILQGALEMLGTGAPAVEPRGLTPEDVVAGAQMAAQAGASREGTLAQVSGITELMEKIPLIRAQAQYYGGMPAAKVRAAELAAAPTALDQAKIDRLKIQGTLDQANADLITKKLGSYLNVTIEGETYAIPTTDYLKVLESADRTTVEKLKQGVSASREAREATETAFDKTKRLADVESAILGGDLTRVSEFNTTSDKHYVYIFVNRP